MIDVRRLLQALFTGTQTNLNGLERPLPNYPTDPQGYSMCVISPLPRPNSTYAYDTLYPRQNPGRKIMYMEILTSWNATTRSHPEEV